MLIIAENRFLKIYVRIFNGNEKRGSEKSVEVKVLMRSHFYATWHGVWFWSAVNNVAFVILRASKKIVSFQLYCAIIMIIAFQLDTVLIPVMVGYSYSRIYNKGLSTQLAPFLQTGINFNFTCMRTENELKRKATLVILIQWACAVKLEVDGCWLWELRLHQDTELCFFSVRICMSKFTHSNYPYFLFQS